MASAMAYFSSYDANLRSRISIFLELQSDLARGVVLSYIVRASISRAAERFWHGEDEYSSMYGAIFMFDYAHFQCCTSNGGGGVGLTSIDFHLF